MTDLADRVAELHRLHESGCFVIPNPWDVGTACALVQLGFPALATTSSGSAWASGRSDAATPLEAALVHGGVMAAAVDIPVSLDFQDGFAAEPEGVHANVLKGTGTGVAGLSIEDSTRDGEPPLYDFDLAVERIRAARRAIDESGTGLLLTGRSEGFIRGRPDLAETIRRLSAYGEAGADCLYAPGLSNLEDIRQVVQAVSPKPVNVLVGAPGTTVAELAEIGVRRISVGGALARAAWGAFLVAAGEIARDGTFEHLGSAAAFSEVDGRFSEAGSR